MMTDRGKRSKVSSFTEENTDHTDKALALSMERLHEVQEELEKKFLFISPYVKEKASDKVLEVEQKFNEVRRPVYEKRNEIIKKIPDFWLTAFMNHPALGELLNPQDQQIFKYIESLDVGDFKDVKSGYAIAFNFKPNPYFEDTKLVKTFTFVDEGVKIDGTRMKWKKGMGAKTGGNSEEIGNKRPPSDDSFFTWFAETQPHAVAGFTDEVADIIKQDLWPNPLKYFSSEPDEEDSDEDEDDDESSQANTKNKGKRVIEESNHESQTSSRKIAGVIFMCDARTKTDCFQHKVMGASHKNKESVMRIQPGVNLFLFDIDVKKLYGVYKASSAGGKRLVPSAFGGGFPFQVRFKIHKEFYPIPERVFKQAVIENYDKTSRFKTELTYAQLLKVKKAFRDHSRRLFHMTFSSEQGDQHAVCDPYDDHTKSLVGRYLSMAPVAPPSQLRNTGKECRRTNKEPGFADRRYPSEDEYRTYGLKGPRVLPPIVHDLFGAESYSSGSKYTWPVPVIGTEPNRRFHGSEPAVRNTWPVPVIGTEQNRRFHGSEPVVRNTWPVPVIGTEPNRRFHGSEPAVPQFRTGGSKEPAVPRFHSSTRF